MKSTLANEIIDCMPKGRTHYVYYKDKYAFKLLQYASGKKTSIAKIKNSRYERLLTKPVVKEYLAHYGNGYVDPKELDKHWNEPHEPFLLSLDTWDASDKYWSQSTRGGVNLVLQMNFTNKHRQEYLRYIKDIADMEPFIFSCHPVMDSYISEQYRDTLAWARIDLDLRHNEAIIEEIQNDWLRRVKRCYLLAKREKAKNSNEMTIYDTKVSVEKVIDYVEITLKNYFEFWDEAIFTAAIQFIKEELGISNIYYHTYKTGKRLKNIDGMPPKSLYTTLPKKFCFEETDIEPEFLNKDKKFKRIKKAVRNLSWYKLDLSTH